MIESIMFFGLGFLVSSLLGLIILPLVHARAVRLTTRRIEASAPVSMAEIQADKDQLRAEFAMSTRRLEMSVEQLKARTTGQLTDLGKQTEAVNKLKAELGEKTAAIAALNTREKALQEQLRSTEEELGRKTESLRDAERKLAEKDAELEKRSVAADGQRIEMVTLRTQIATLRDQFSDLEQQVKHADARATHERLEVEKVTQALADERGKVGDLGAQLAELHRQLAAQTAEAEMLNRRIAEREAQLTEHAGQLRDANHEHGRLRGEIDAALRVEKGLREELATADQSHAAAMQALRTEKSMAEVHLERVSEERGKLQQEMAVLKRNAESSWESERMENALLRERINDVSAQVASLTVALEGPESPIVAILGGGDTAHHDEHVNGAQNGGEPIALKRVNGSLADRIRALQSRAASRAGAER